MRAMRTGRRQAGMNLIELLVAITIGLFLLDGAITIFINSKRSYSSVDDLARIQENARVALDTMVTDIRMTGYMGCINGDLQSVTNQVSGAAPQDMQTVLEAYQGGDATWMPLDRAGNNISSLGDVPLIATAGGANVGDMIAGTDAIIVRHLSGTSIPLKTKMASESAPLELVANPYRGFTIKPCAIVAVSDCTSTNIFKETTDLVKCNTPDPTKDITLLNHDKAGNGNVSAELRNDHDHPDSGAVKIYDVKVDPKSNPATPEENDKEFTRVSGFVDVTYYIGRTATGADPKPGLFRIRNGAMDIDPATNLPVPLATGVENMQITYGTGTGGSAPTQYAAADVLGTDLAQWSNVTSVRIGLLLRSEEESPTNILNTKTYTINDLVDFAAPQDHRRRKVMLMTVYLRNRIQPL